MKRLLFLSIVLSGLLLSCGNNDSNPVTAEKKNYAKTKKILQEKEEKNPQNFLWVEGHDKRNILGQTVIKGTITNKATVAVFKDVDLKLSFYSKTHTLLETDKETVFEVLHPGESKNFKTKYFAPKGTDSVALEVLGARVVAE